MPLDAFISYSHAGERALAAALQQELQRLGKRWWQRRALRVFRDETNLAAAPQLWDMIARALDDAGWLVLMASPQAVASPWVERELARWRERKDPDRILIVLCAGTLAWDAARNDFDWARTDALPRAFSGAFAGEPLWVDLRAEAAPDPTRLRTAAARLAAPIHGKPFEDLLSDDLSAHRSALRLAWTTAGVLLVLAVAAVVAGVQAVRSGNEARRQLRTANARRLALQGSVAAHIDQRVDLALLLALESLRVEPSREATRVVLDTLSGVADAEVFFRGWGRSFTGVAFSENGAHLSAVDDGRAVFTWDLASPRRAPATDRHPVEEGSLHLSKGRREVVVELEGEVTAVDRASRLAARAEDDGSIAIWSFETGTPVSRLAHVPAAKALVFRPGGELLATGDAEGAVRVWSVRTGRLVVGPLRGHSAGETGAGILAVALAPDGRHLASAGEDGRVLLWDVSARPPAHRLVKLLHSTAHRLVFNWNGSLLAAAYSDLAELWDVESLESQWTLAGHAALVHDVAFAPDGRRAATASQDGSVVLWALDDRPSVVRRFDGHGASVVAAAFTGSAERARTLDHGGTLLEWDFSTFPAAARASRLDSDAGGLAAFTSDGRSLVAAGDEGRELVRWDLDAPAPTRARIATLPDPAAALAAAPSRPCVAVASDGGDVQVLEVGADGAQVLLAARAPRDLSFVAIAPGCDSVAVAYLNGGFSLWDVGTGARRDVSDAHGGQVLGIALDGRGLVATAGGGTVQLWRTSDLKPIGGALPAHPTGGPVTLAFDAEGRRLISSGGDSRVHLWDLDALSAGPTTISDLAKAAQAVALAPGGARLLLGDNAGMVRLRDLEPARWTDRACALVNRDLTELEWRTYLAPEPYRETCGGDLSTVEARR